MPVLAGEDAPATKPSPSVARSTALMSVSTASSRVAGFVRTWAMAVALGVTLDSKGAIPIASAYTIANNIPNMIYEFLAGGVLSSMLIPAYLEKLKRDGRDGAFRMTNTLLSIAFIIMGIVAVIGTLWPQPFVFTQTFTRSREEAQLAVYLFRFFAVQIIIYGWCAVTTGVLNSHRHFFAPAIAPLINNVVVIVTLLGFYVPLRDSRPDLALIALGVGTTLGVVSMLVTQVPPLLKLGFRIRPNLDLSDPVLRKMGRSTLYVVAYVVVNLIGVSFRNAFALNAMPDGPAALTYAWLWYQLPYGIFAVALITALFPELSSMAHDEAWDGFKIAFARGLRVMSLLIVPFAGMLIALSTPLVRLFRFGEFPADAVPLVAGVLVVWAAGLTSFATYMLVFRAFCATQDFKTPAVTNAIVHVLQIALYAGLTSVTAWGNWRLLGIPAADAVTFTVHTAILVVILRRRIGAFDGRRVVSTAARVVLASAVGAGAAWTVVALTAGLTASRFGFIVQLLAGGLAGLGVTYALVALLRVPEIADGLAMLRRVTGRLLPGRAGSEA